MVYYTQRASSVLAIGGKGRVDVILVDRHHKEIQVLQSNIRDLTLQCDT